ncbi:hypothetical protein CXF56_03485 [Psychrobacter sp. Choline-02u-13]|uniref:HEPN domain-containing protein n=1 Tax=unclassified Psychrobacter TaxID=196806 RepID=UPI000C7BF187|nr:MULTISPECIES: HEPN domain-containing protein [unclassified Psychrobacter]PKG67304.1 hypothetical protein CXF56_03485 [Psychrobacter sp. Choline-02u-13]PKH54130.1 hypothetical protein CXF69_04780 [Psychrobacter sp. Choline-02u-9]
MLYQRIENALKLCGEHIASFDSSEARYREVETYLVAGLVLLIVSEYEDHLESVFVKRAEQCGDLHAINYIKKTLSQKFRSPDLGKINETLNRFDNSYKTLFFKDIENSPEHAAWDSLLKARHAVVHKKGTLNLTFRELQTNYLLTKKIVREVETVLNVNTQTDLV